MNSKEPTPSAFFAKLGSLVSRLRGNGTPKTEIYGTPGQGRSLWIAICSSLGLFFVWYFITQPIFPDPDDATLKIPFIRPLFLPGPEAVFVKFISLFTEEFNGGTLQQHILWSVFRVFSAFLLAVVTAIPLGIIMGINVTFRGIFDPPIEFYRPIPPLAYLPLMIIWFGIGELSKILLIYLAVFSAIVINTRSGVRSAGIEQIHAAYSLGASRFQVITQVIFKAALPEILTGTRVGVGFGWTTLVAAELVAAEQGIGAMIKGASDFLVTDVVIVGIIVIGVIAYLFDMLMRYMEYLIVPWKGKMT